MTIMTKLNKEFNEPDLSSLKKDFLKRLHARYGIVSLACTDLNLSEETVHAWIREDSTFAHDVEHARERMVDFVEAKMFEKIGTGNERLIRFFLETQGKNRGYVTRHEIGVPLTDRLELSPEEALILESNVEQLTQEQTRKEEWNSEEEEVNA